MENMSIRISPRFLFAVILLSSGGFFLSGLISPISAQNFAGSDISNYYCPGKVNADGDFVTGPDVREVQGDYLCDYDGDGVAETRAVPRPPTLRQLEYWFVKIVYLAWAASGIIFTVILMWIGWLYMTSFNNEFLLADVIKRMRNWALGLAIVFLAYPILNTFFNVLGLRRSECFENINLPGFQFFFSTACNIDEISEAQCISDCMLITDSNQRQICIRSCSSIN